MHAFDFGEFWRKRDPCAWSVRWWKIGKLRWEERELEVRPRDYSSWQKTKKPSQVLMGGEATEISEKSASCQSPEAAVFNGKSIRDQRSLNLRSESSSLWKKASMWQLSMKPLMRQRAWLQHLQVTVRKGIVQQASSILDVEVSSTLADVNCVLGTEFLSLRRRKRCLPSIWSFWKAEAFTGSAFHVAVGTSPSKRTLEEIDRIILWQITKQLFPKRWWTAGELTVTQNCVVKFVPLLEGAGLTEIITLYNSQSSGSLPSPSNWTELMCQWLWIVQPRQNMISGTRYCKAYNVARKIWPSMIWKFFEQTQSKRRLRQTKQQLCSLL